MFGILRAMRENLENSINAAALRDLIITHAQNFTGNADSTEEKQFLINKICETGRALEQIQHNETIRVNLNNIIYDLKREKNGKILLTEID